MISNRYCLEDGIHEEQAMENCITVAAENSRFPVDLDDIRNIVIPVLLRTVVKGIAKNYNNSHFFRAS